MVIKLLEAVPSQGEASTIALAFQSIQLVAADFMPNLPASLLKCTIALAASYATQQAHLHSLVPAQVVNCTMKGSQYSPVWSSECKQSEELFKAFSSTYFLVSFALDTILGPTIHFSTWNLSAWVVGVKCIHRVFEEHVHGSVPWLALKTVSTKALLEEIAKKAEDNLTCLGRRLTWTLV